MSFDDIAPIPYVPARNGSLVLMLSLFLIMLVFFVLLNALSRPVEEKQAAAMYGVQEGFDYRIDPNKQAELLATQAGPLWFEAVEAKVREVMAKEWPDARVTSSESAGMVEAALGLADVWKENVWSDAFVAVAQNLRMVLKEFPEVQVRVVVASAAREGATPMLQAFAEQLPEMPAGWQVREVAKDGTAGMDTVTFVVTHATVLPEGIVASGTAVPIRAQEGAAARE